MTTINSLSRQIAVPIRNQEAINQPDTNKGKIVSPVVCNLARIQNGPDRLYKQEDFLADLKRALANRKSGVEAGDMKSDTQALKPWQRELAQQKEAYARSAPEREAAEAKEEKRVRVALNAEEAEKAKQKAAEAEKANRPVAPLKLDAKGVPLPPPPPINMPAKKPDSSNVTAKANVNNASKREAEMKHRQDDLIKDLTAALAKRVGKTNSEIKSPLEALKPWQKELAELKQAYERAAPQREIAEAKEEARVTIALKAEAAEKAKMKATEAEKENKPVAALKLDAKGIPLPPPPPPLGRFK